MVDLMSGIAGLTAVLGLAKDVKLAVDKIGDVEVKVQMADLYSKLADVKMEAVAHMHRIAELEAELSLKKQMTYEPPYYWALEDDGVKNGPYCQSCYDSNQKAIRLQSEGNGSWRCLTCEGFFTDKDHVEPDGYPSVCAGDY